MNDHLQLQAFWVMAFGFEGVLSGLLWGYVFRKPARLKRVRIYLQVMALLPAVAIVISFAYGLSLGMTPLAGISWMLAFYVGAKFDGGRKRVIVPSAKSADQLACTLLSWLYTRWYDPLVRLKPSGSDSRPYLLHL